jgi:tRNA threonylcarbamoyladenosine biosynthesis protein TsaE
VFGVMPLQILLQKYDSYTDQPIILLAIFYTLLQMLKYICVLKMIYQLEKIEEAAAMLLHSAGSKKIIAFHGSMGAGKTTLIHALCEAKVVKDVVTSPTFSIINEYNFPGGKIYHIDLYRLKDEEEALRAGVEDCLYSNHLCFVEWPEKAPGIFPPDTLHVFIEPTDAQTRQLTIPDK